MNKIEYYAHTVPEKQPDTWQTLGDHHENVARLAGKFAQIFGAKEWGEIAGWCHDLGKLQPTFQAYLFYANGKTHPNSTYSYRPSQGKIPHAIVGARVVLAADPQKNAGLLLAHIIAGHHAGLHNGLILNERLSDDTKTPLPDLPPVIRDLEFPARFPFTMANPQDKTRCGFQVSFFARLLFSCLVDADFLDTEEFMDRDKSTQRGGYPVLAELNERFSRKLEALTASVNMDATGSVNACRREILRHCQAAASLEPGLFSLTVPTGGGKTLSSLSFALRHAKQHGLRRIIYAIPFTSIIEQNAQVFREYLGEDAVLEHHSNFDFDTAGKHGRNLKLAAENWDTPIVVTTTVQLFDSLFANRTSKCRKLHNLVNSVIILDEVQSLPVEKLRPCLEVIRELAANYGATVVLCSATQPAITLRDEFPQGLAGVREIIPEPAKYFAALQRTEIKVLAGQVDDATIAARLREEPQVLVIVNTKKHARDLFNLIREEEGAFHLSAAMCPAHRQRQFAEISQRLSDGQPCRVVSTQVIEAGVDVDFPVVFRAFAGLDSIAQAAGRCNREGKRTVNGQPAPGEVNVFRPTEVCLRGGFGRRGGSTEKILDKHADDLLSPAAIEAYFREYYWQAKYLDKKNFYALPNDARHQGQMRFADEAEFSLIDSATRAIIIPWKGKGENTSKAEPLLRELATVKYPRTVLRKLQPYIVQVYEYNFKTLYESGMVDMIAEQFPALVDLCAYDPQCGIIVDAERLIHSPECFMV